MSAKRIIRIIDQRHAASHTCFKFVEIEVLELNGSRIKGRVISLGKCPQCGTPPESLGEIAVYCGFLLESSGLFYKAAPKKTGAVTKEPRLQPLELR